MTIIVKGETRKDSNNCTHFPYAFHLPMHISVFHRIAISKLLFNYYLYILSIMVDIKKY